MRLFSIVILGCSFALSACDTKPISSLNYAERTELLEKFKATCAELGITEKSSKFNACMEAEIQAEEARRATNRETVEAFGDAGENFGNSYNAAARRSVTCNTYAYGRYSSTTNCY